MPQTYQWIYRFVGLPVSAAVSVWNPAGDVAATGTTDEFGALEVELATGRYFANNAAGTKAVEPVAQYEPGSGAAANVADGSVTNAKIAVNAAIAESKLNLASDAAAGTASRRTLGTSATSAAAGNDARLLTGKTISTATAVGANAQAALTTGGSNTAIGQGAQFTLIGGSNNTAIGENSLRYLSSGGGGNIAIGVDTLRASISGADSTAIGTGAGFDPAGVEANGSTTATNQTFIGVRSGQGSATQVDQVVAIGSNALVAGAGAVAIGAGASAGAAGAAAIGRDSAGTPATTTVQNEIKLGTALHTVKILGRLNVAPLTPSSGADTQGAVGDIVSDDTYIYAKTSTGWKRSAITTW